MSSGRRLYCRTTIYRRIRRERLRLGISFVGVSSIAIPGTLETEIIPSEKPDDQVVRDMYPASSVEAIRNQHGSLDTTVTASSIPDAVRLFSIHAKSLTVADLKLLITLLKPLVPELPLDPRTVRNTPRTCPKKVLLKGSYVHIGLHNCLQIVHKKHQLRDGDRLTLQVNVDGLPLFDYPGTEMWPILGRIIRPFVSCPFVIGSYCGGGRPEPLDVYMDDFVTETKDILTNGAYLKALGITVFVTLQSIICDTPARCLIRKVKGHNGYHGCDKCTQRGVYYESRKMAFSVSARELRTNSSFRRQLDDEHHIGLTPLTELPIDMVSQFPLDPMHLVFLGVVKRLVRIWRLSDIVRGVRLSASMQKAIDVNLSVVSKCLTMDFPRKCCSFVSPERWKATECRQFLLYLGPVVLKKCLRNDCYENFLNLFLSIYILSHPSYMSFIHIARYLILKFVNQFAFLYGDDEVVYNVHCLSHLCDDVEKLGPLHMFWSFPFESFMSQVKRLVKGPKSPEVQVHNRVYERSISTKIVDIDVLQDDTFLPVKCATHQRSFMPRANLLLSCSKPDNCVIIHKRPYLIDNRQSHDVHCRPFLSVVEFCNHGFSSSVLYIFRAKSLSTVTSVKRIVDIICKCVCLYHEDEYGEPSFIQVDRVDLDNHE